jgi:hypothetical protein
LWSATKLTKLVTNAKSGAEAGIVGKKFLEVDPSAFTVRPKSIWNRRRLAYLAELSEQRHVK